MTTAHSNTGALITGGSQGLGLAIAKTLISQGCTRLVITSNDPVKGPAAEAELRALGADAYFFETDMGDIKAVLSMLPKAISRIGPVTALVNCAANTARGSILDTTPELWDRVMDPNAKGAFFALQAFAQHCIDANHDGAAINILSITVHGGLPFLAPYVASKAALLGVTKNAAATLAQHRIRVNGINVGWMDTPGEDATQQKFHGRSDGWLKEAEAAQPFGQLVKPEEVAGQCAFLLGPDSGVVTGSIIDFDQVVVGAYPDTGEG